MNATFLQLMGATLISVLPDVAPPPEAVAVVSLGVLLGLGCLVVAIVGVSFFVIRAIRKNRTPREGP
jgi:hypothetical protein